MKEERNVSAQLARYANILGIQTESGKVVGFHTHNLQVASLSESLWNTLASAALSSSTDSEERSELDAWNREIDIETTDADIPQEVRSLMVNVVQVCNLKCVYCAAGGDGSFGQATKHVEIDTIRDQIRMLLHDIPNGGTFSLTFFGGEPLIAPDTIRNLARFTKLQAAGRDIKIRFYVITNGTLLTPEIAELLASIGCHVTVSLDGPSDINDRNRPTRGGLGSTARTLKGLELLKTVRDRLSSLTVGAVFGGHNTDVLGTYKFLKELGFDSMKFDFAAEINDTDASQAYMRSLAETADYAFKSGGESELRKIEQFDSYFRALDQKRRLNNHCGAGKSHLTTDAQGRLTACQWFAGQAGEEVGRGLNIDSEKLKAFAPRLNDMNNCGSCWARHLCGGGCMYVNQLKNGSKHKKDKDFCDRTRNTIAKAIEYYAEARSESDERGTSETH